MSCNQLISLEALRPISLSGLKTFTVFGNQIGCQIDNIESDSDLQLKLLVDQISIIQRSCPSVERLLFDGNPVSSYIDKTIYKKTIQDLLKPSIRYIDNEQIDF